MSSSDRVSRGRTRPAPTQPPRRRAVLLFVAIGVAAVALVAVFIGLQATSGSSDKVPERVSTGQGRVLGDPNAPVTVVEYADFQCPVCKRAETAVRAQLEKDYVQSGKVNIEFRMYPFIGQESFNAAQAADAAGDQGKFWEYHDALFNAQGSENGGNFTYDKLVAIAKQVGLDVPKFEETLSSNVHLADIQKEADAAHAAGVSSTPTFFIGGKKIVGVQAYSEFKSAIADALAKTP
jgi:protein-disulfide isomerase